MQNPLKVYRALSEPDKPQWRGGSWRLPSRVFEERITGPFLEIRLNYNVNAMLLFAEFDRNSLAMAQARVCCPHFTSIFSGLTGQACYT